MLVRKIPRSGEAIAAVGLGTGHDTWHDHADGKLGPGREALVSVVNAFFRAEGRVLDCSAHPGTDVVLGEVMGRVRAVPGTFMAAKIRTTGRREGEAQLAAALKRLGRVDLMQIHNLRDCPAHLPALRAARDAGRIRYTGVTHFSPAVFDEIEKIVRAGQVDFVQIPYSLHARAAESRLLPAAKDTGTAVMVMLPFEAGGLFAQLRGRPLPAWAAEIDCSSWAQVLLKFILSHPAVTCVIPATDKLEHLADNLRAGMGRLPDEALRKRMVQELG